MKFVFTWGLALSIGSLAGSLLFGQNISIGLSVSKDQLTFQGTGTQVINVVWQACDNSGCTMEGSASRMGSVGPAGTYKFSSSTATPFKLVASSGQGLFSVDQSSAISFSYTSQQGTLVGQAHFTSVVQNQGSIAASLAGTLQVRGGTYAPSFASGPGTLSLTLALGKNLSTLVDSAGTISGEIDTMSSLRPSSPCRDASAILSSLNDRPLSAGEYIWFNASFSASGIHDGTSLQFQVAYVQFQANGNTYILQVPNAKVDFSSSIRCAATRFDADSGAWKTTVPVGGSDAIFLSGLSFPVPASGLPGGIGAVDWGESFSSNTPGVLIQWKWRAVVFGSFSTDYNSLEVKPMWQDSCLNNADQAGTSERFRNSAVGEARGDSTHITDSWSDTANAEANCP